MSDGRYTWEERKAQYDRHYFVEYGGYVGEDGTPGYRLDHIVERCKAIIALFQLDSVLDCGCAHGWLIHGVKEIDPDIDARGFDVSEFAISHADSSIRDRLSVLDITEELPFGNREFDLATCFDVLEHLYPYEKIVRAVEEMCRVSKKWILLRQPMTSWEGGSKEWHKWLGTLNDLPHRSRLALIGAVSNLKHICPVAGDKEHPSEHPREFWIELFRYFNYTLMDIPEETYWFPNPNMFCSYNLLVFKRR